MWHFLILEMKFNILVYVGQSSNKFYNTYEIPVTL